MNNTAISYARYSSEGQSEGDSIRRQVEAAEAYAKANNLVIDKDRSFRDLGVSAWDKSNVRKGALGLFLRAVEDGKIEPGTTLIVESFDRLSRAKPREALGIFTNIINAGLVIVTLTKPPKVFSQKSLDDNNFQLIEALLDMHRAHQESERKSGLGTSNWNKKKGMAEQGQLMTARAPHWIKVTVDGNKGRYEPGKRTAELVPDRAAVVLKMIDMAMHGVGNNTIIRTLHAEGIEAWSKSGKWQPSYVQKTLCNPALYGAIEVDEPLKESAEKQEVKKVTLTDYYPPLIDKARFEYLRSIRTTRATRKTQSRKGKAVTNLFSGLLKCGYCHSPMTIAGYKAKKTGYDRKYVACHGARIGAPGKCSKMRIWFLDELETKLLFWVATLNYKVLFASNQTKLDAAKQELASINASLTEVQRRISNINEALADVVPPKLTIGMLHKLELKASDLGEAAEKQRLQVATLAAHEGRGKQHMEGLITLFKALARANDDEVELRRLRESISELIAQTVERVTLHPVGPTVNGTKAERYMVATLKNGQTFEIDDADDGGESMQVDPVMLQQVLAEPD